MKRKKPTPRGLSEEHSDLAVNFYGVARDHLAESFEQIAKRVVPRGFGRSKGSPAFKKAAQRMFNLAR